MGGATDKLCYRRMNSNTRVVSTHERCYIQMKAARTTVDGTANRFFYGLFGRTISFFQMFLAPVIVSVEFGSLLFSSFVILLLLLSLTRRMVGA